MKNIPKKIRDEVLERDSFDGCPCCIYCGSPFSLNLHHYKRRSMGGKDEVKNIVALCFNCHRALHDGNKEIEEFVGDYLRSNYE